MFSKVNRNALLLLPLLLTLAIIKVIFILFRWIFGITRVRIDLVLSPDRENENSSFAFIDDSNTPLSAVRKATKARCPVFQAYCTYTQIRVVTRVIRMEQYYYSNLIIIIIIIRFEYNNYYNNYNRVIHISLHQVGTMCCKLSTVHLKR